METRKDTRTDLVEELLKVKQYPEIVFMITEAKAGEYHDYKNKKYDCGKTESYNRLMGLFRHYGDSQLYAIARRIAEGEFDEVADTDDLQTMRDDLLQMCGGDQEQFQRMCKTLGIE